jgi:hypothetical protein
MVNDWFRLSPNLDDFTRGLADTVIRPDSASLSPVFASMGDFGLKSNAYRIVFLEPSFRGVRICKHLQVIGVFDLFARIDVDEDCHWSLSNRRIVYPKAELG